MEDFVLLLIVLVTVLIQMLSVNGAPSPHEKMGNTFYTVTFSGNTGTPELASVSTTVSFPNLTQELLFQYHGLLLSLQDRNAWHLASLWRTLPHNHPPEVSGLTRTDICHLPVRGAQARSSQCQPKTLGEGKKTKQNNLPLWPSPRTRENSQAARRTKAGPRWQLCRQSSAAVRKARAEPHIMQSSPPRARCLAAFLTCARDLGAHLGARGPRIPRTFSTGRTDPPRGSE